MLEPAAPVDLRRRGEWLIIHPHGIGLPPHCVACGAATERMFRPPMAISQDSETFPCCETCQPQLRWNWWLTAIRVITTTTLLVVAINLLIPRSSAPGLKAAVLGITAIVGVVVGAVLVILLPNVIGQPLRRRNVFPDRGWVAIHSKNPVYRQLLELRYGDAQSYVLGRAQQQ